ncbi:MAG: uracil-DNA glycosylase [Balneolaceae bacterium]
MVSQFIDSLEHKPNDCLFSPWFDNDPGHDFCRDAPAVRRRQFQSYLEERVGRAKFLFIAEALGYQGGHFTGIAMTSERILLGHQEKKYGVLPGHVFSRIRPARTSRADVNVKGMSEPTATMMWGALIELGIDPYDVVLWNAVPWHPFRPEKGLMSNRTPTRPEMKAGLRLLKPFLELFAAAQPVAVGRKCEETLLHLGIEHVQVRHPANGGAPVFRKQIRALLG